MRRIWCALGLVCVVWLGMTFVDVALLECELFGGLFGAMLCLCVVGWCMGFCVISLSVFGILIYIGGK